MLRLTHVCVIVLLAPATGAASRITFERTLPARHNLAGAEDLVITYAIGDNDRISTFIDVFVDQTNRSEMLRVLDPTTVERSTERSRRWRQPPKYVEQRYRADAYLRIDAFRCQTNEKSGQGSSYDVDGNRVRRTKHWIDAVCEVHIDALTKDKKKLAEFTVHGEGTSPRVEELTDEERDVAVDQAARYAAVAAAQEITPRRVRETITLVDEAPHFDAGMAMIDAEQLDEARRIWEGALPENQQSAALHFNLATVCEAVGDLDAAEDHYATAQRLAPKDPRYRYEHDRFRRRNGLKK
jgi:tetratricopeptide (TPR) repeat protein